jgi:hypothetical protein
MTAVLLHMSRNVLKEDWSELPTDRNLISGATGDDPFVVLARDLGYELEVGVVVQDGESPALSGSGHERINQG